LLSLPWTRGLNAIHDTHMTQEQIAYGYEHQPPPLGQKIRLYFLAFLGVPFYRYGEIGNIVYTVGKNILDGVVLFTMFSMAEKELKVAAILGVMVKYAYPGITIVSSTYTSGFIDQLEAFRDIKNQIGKLISAHVGIAAGQALGAVFLFLCFPPVFKHFFSSFSFQGYLLIALYFLHHVSDGSAQIVEGRTWFKIIEIKIRRGEDQKLSQNFWVIYALSQNFQLILGQLFIWSALGITAEFSSTLTSPVMTSVVSFGLGCVMVSKFILPAAYKLRFCA
jgi:hypothetical protein